MMKSSSCLHSCLGRSFATTVLALQYHFRALIPDEPASLSFEAGEEFDLNIRYLVLAGSLHASSLSSRFVSIGWLAVDGVP